MAVTDKEHAKQVVHTTLTTVKQYLAQESPPKLSESDTKANFVDPILSALGWTGIGIVVREYYVKNSQEFIDYVMRDRGKSLLAIEAKALQVDLTEKASAQLVQYCVVEGIEWAALTNGREMRFFNTNLKGDLAARLILPLDLLAFNSHAEYDALFNQLWLLSRESMATPAGIRTWMEQRRMDQALRSVLLNPISPMVKSLRKYLADNDIKASSEDVAQWFRAQFMAHVTPLPPAATNTPPPLRDIIPPNKAATLPPTSVQQGPLVLVSGNTGHYLLPAAKWQQQDALEHLHAWLDRGMWGMHERTSGRKRLRGGDKVCFYATKTGIVATATVTGEATVPMRDDEVPTGPPEDTIYRVPLADVIWLPTPIELDATLLTQLDAFAGKSLQRWSWLVQTTTKLSAHDYALMTGQNVSTTVSDTA